MNPLILAYIQAEQAAYLARKNVALTLALATEQAEPAGALRVATPADIVVGAVLWYEHDGWNPEWTEKRYYFQIVGDVHRPSDPWKAYTSHSGCCYGLNGAMVEVEDASS